MIIGASGTARLWIGSNEPFDDIGFDVPAVVHNQSVSAPRDLGTAPLGDLTRFLDVHDWLKTEWMCWIVSEPIRPNQ